VKAPKTSGGRRTPVRHTIPLGIVIFLVFYIFQSESSQRESEKSSLVRQLNEKLTELTEYKRTVLGLEERLKTSQSTVDELQRSVTSWQHKCNDVTEG